MVIAYWSVDDLIAHFGHHGWEHIRPDLVEKGSKYMFKWKDNPKIVILLTIPNPRTIFHTQVAVFCRNNGIPLPEVFETVQGQYEAMLHRTKHPFEEE